MSRLHTFQYRRHHSQNRSHRQMRGKHLTLSRRIGESSNDKVILFDHLPHLTRHNSSHSPIREHIRSIEARLAARTMSKNSKAPVQQMNNEMSRKHHTKFIGKMTKVENEKRANSSHTIELDDASEEIFMDFHSKDRNSISPEDVKLLPKIPKVGCFANKGKQIERVEGEKDLIADKSSTMTTTFSKAHPRENNPKNARIDLSLPNINDILNELKIDGNRQTPASSAGECNETKMSVDSRKILPKSDNSLSGMRRSYRKIISSKLEKYKSASSEDVQKRLEEQIENESESDQKQSILSPSSTSCHRSSDLVRNSEIGSEPEQERKLKNQQQMEKFKVLN